jgi:hypothetical protein
MHTHTRTFAAAALAVSLLLVPAACSDDDEAGAGAESTTSTSTAPPTPEEPTTDEPAEEPGVVEVSAVDFGFEDLPEEVPAGTRLTLVNTSTVELHELVAARLPDDEERPLEELVALPEAELSALIGVPATVLLAAPGGDVIPAVGDGTLAEPGRYLVLCFIPTGADPQEYLAAAAASGGAPPEVAGGPPHVAHGMYAELSVR